jgi:2-polyprenyl-6-hydroxyphenyl methylase/3-demethylubiquinone-9 3-methyltransferase
LVAAEVKRCLGLTVTGLDADAGELALMAPGLCDRTITADLCDFRGDGSADLVICRCVLEHVPDTDMAFSALATILRPGGLLAICVPCRNAPFARLNLMLPQRLKKKLLYTIWPHKGDGHAGFPAFYHGCAPSRFQELARRHGLEVVDCRAYWWSSYFTFLLPLWGAWRLWQIVARAVAGDDACEGFVLVARRRLS